MPKPPNAFTTCLRRPSISLTTVPTKLIFNVATGYETPEARVFASRRHRAPARPEDSTDRPSPGRTAEGEPPGEIDLVALVGRSLG